MQDPARTCKDLAKTLHLSWQYQLHKLQRVQNAAAWLIFGTLFLQIFVVHRMLTVLRGFLIKTNLIFLDQPMIIPIFVIINILQCMYCNYCKQLCVSTYFIVHCNAHSIIASCRTHNINHYYYVYYYVYYYCSNGIYK